ncbi:MAG: penicillin-binding protein 2 [Desulfurella sp.]|uniref:penicillin-binding protein 2 n=1 Tax=Desulfurella sp. TaxID=1962857 RepID=UPI003D0E813E
MPRKIDIPVSKNFTTAKNYIKFILLIATIIIIGRLFYLQVINYNQYNEMAKNNCLRLIGIRPARGEILTSDNYIIASNEPSFTLYFTRNIKTDQKEIDLLSKILNEPKNKIEKKINSIGYFSTQILANNISHDQVFEILSHKNTLKNVDVEIEPKRVYLGNPYIYASVVGYIQEANQQDIEKGAIPGSYVGQMGVEKLFNKQLQGTWGYKEVERNVSGTTVKVLGQQNPIKGENIRLTINYKAQQIAYDALGNYKGAVVILKSNGDVLALVSKPSFNPNDFVEGISEAEWKQLQEGDKISLFNRAVQGAYPPGSTIKPFLIFAALQKGIITPDTYLYCPYEIKIGKYTFKDWKPGGFGKINLYTALAGSSDVFMYQIGMKLGIKTIDEYLQKFGFGKSVGLFGYESKGIIASPRYKYEMYHTPWYLGDTITSAIGQAYTLVTPLQLAVAFSVIANDGIAYKPRLSYIQPHEILYDIKNAKKDFEIIKDALELTVSSPVGTAHNAYIPNLTICGKTGTAQVVTSQQLNTLLVNSNWDLNKIRKYLPQAWFASFAPKHHPQIIMVVFLEHGYDSHYAAAVSKKIYEGLLKYHLIEPNK